MGGYKLGGLVCMWDGEGGRVADGDWRPIVNPQIFCIRSPAMFQNIGRPWFNA